MHHFEIWVSNATRALLAGLSESLQVLKLRGAYPSSALSVEEMIQIGPFAHWTMDCKLLVPASSDAIQSGTDGDASWGLKLAVGLSDNAVDTYELFWETGNMVCH